MPMLIALCEHRMHDLAAKLQRNLSEYVEFLSELQKEIWPPKINLNCLPGPLVENVK